MMILYGARAKSIIQWLRYVIKRRATFKIGILYSTRTRVECIPVCYICQLVYLHALEVLFFQWNTKHPLKGTVVLGLCNSVERLLKRINLKTIYQ